MSLTRLSDLDLVAGFQDVLVEERERIVLSLEYIAELDRRKLFFHYPSLRAYLVSEHGMEEWNAERRIRAARLMGRLPEIKKKLESGKLNLTLLELAQGCAYREKLSGPELSALLCSISGMSSREAMREIAFRFPESASLPRDKVTPITEELSEVRFVASEKLLETLEEVRGLLAHSHPEMSLGELIEHIALEYRKRHHPGEKAKRAEERQQKQRQQNEEKEQQLQPEHQSQQKEQPEQQPSKAVDSPTAPWVRVPSRKQIYELVRKNGYSCAYVDPVTKRRCSSTFGLQIDHVQAWSEGGETKLTNLRFLCRNHHRRVSFLQFGEASRYFRGR